MKKYLILPIMVLVTGFCLAQNSNKGGGGIKFGVGFRGGVILPEITGEDLGTLGQKSVAGPQLGGIFNLRFGRGIVSIQPEILYESNKVELNQGDTIKVTDQTSFIRVPLLLKLSTPADKTVSIFVTAGPDVGFAISSELQAKLNGTDVAFNTPEDINKLLNEAPENEELVKKNFGDSKNDIDWAMNFGGGIGFSFGGNMITLDARRIIGLSEISTIEDFTSNKNAAWNFSIGYFKSF